jgi:thiamine pyrophosphate-dependent acetolactate synthase large subunit-like protein
MQANDHLLRGVPPAANDADRYATTAIAALCGVARKVHRLVPIVGGGNNMPLVEAVRAARMEPIYARSEAGACFMANGIAWESGLPTCCIVITSAGVYGAIQALYTASVNRRPVVLLSGEVGGIGRGSVQAGDGWDGPACTRVTDEFTGWSIDAHTSDQAIRAVARAVELARHERLPVHVNVSVKILGEKL